MRVVVRIYRILRIAKHVEIFRSASFCGSAGACG
jgi:hypothetical protein